MYIYIYTEGERALHGGVSQSARPSESPHYFSIKPTQCHVFIATRCCRGTQAVLSINHVWNTALGHLTSHGSLVFSSKYLHVGCGLTITKLA